jgi:hypothetical protein
MAQLLFYDSEHRYELDGEVLPSVSEIIRFISREVYGDIAQYKLDHAADRGMRIHKACEVLDKYGRVDADDEIVPYVKAYIQFRKDHRVKWKYIEKAFYHPTLKYAGTIDRYGEFDGDHVIIDIKSAYTLPKRLVNAQLNGYNDMFTAATNEPVDKLYALHLKPDATYKLIPFTIDLTTFAACLTLHNDLKKKARKKNSGNTEDGKPE